MALASWQASIVDDAGNVVPSATIMVAREIAGAPPAQCYSDRNGNTSIGSTFSADSDGFVRFFVPGGAYKITATSGAFSREWRYVPIGTAAETDAGLLPTVPLPTVWMFDSATAAADPGSGEFRLNNATPASATALYIDNENGDGNDVSAWLDSFDDLGDTSTRGRLYICDPDQPTEVFRIYAVSGSVVNSTGYRTITIAHVTGAGSLTAGTLYSFVFASCGPLHAQEAAQAAQAAAEAAQAAAELAETHAETAETNAEAAQAAAESAASTATTQAGISTTQAGIATTQAGLAATSASNASTAETNAEAAQAAAEVAQAAAEAAQAAAEATDIGAHLADTTAAHAASAISYAGGTGMSATDVEGAIDELATEKANAAVSLTASSGLTGGGDLSANRTFTVGAGTGITVNTDDVALDTSSARNVDHGGVTITAGAGLTGGGTIESTRTLDVGAGTGIIANTNDVAIDKASDANVRTSASNKVVTSDLIESASAGVALSDGATVSVDWDAFVFGTLTVAGNRTLGNPTNGQPGTWRTIYVVGNDGTDRTLTFGNQYLGELPTLTDIDNAKGYLLMIMCITTSHFAVSAKRVLG